MAVSSELSLDALLQRLVETAAELTDARYAALGVIDPTGSRLERFFTHGVDADARSAIGEPPRGRGILGVLIHDTKPLRLHDLNADPRAVGFPPGHPPMRSFLGVPVLLRSVAYGNLYLTEKNGGDFTAADEEIVTLLAGQAAVAIENARLYEAATRWSRQLESLNEVSGALATETDLDRLLDLVAHRLRALLGARVVAVLLPTFAGAFRFAAIAGGDAADLLEQTFPRDRSKSGIAFERQQTIRVDSLVDDPDVNHALTRRLDARCGLWVPLLVHGESIGVIVAHDKAAAPDAHFSDDDVRVAEAFAARAAVAVDMSERVARDALRRVVAAQEIERRRLAMELHDGTGQALTSILLALRNADDAAPEVAAAALERARELAVDTLRRVRALAVELRPKALDDFGLQAALARLAATTAEESGVAVDFAATLPEERLPEAVETALYRLAQDSLASAVRHEDAHRVSILLTRNDGKVSVVIEDDGVPAADADLELVRERAALVDGEVRSVAGKPRGSTVVVEVPIR
ncbi:MAG: GAF domain-containing protein [Actinobacteria bacterium]|nr:GAF domain-containing protein [Actinomycetota bacterium]